MRPEKRDAILNGARKVFVKEGYDGASMDAVAREAGVAKPTLYNHFRDKNALYIAVVEASLTQARNEIPGEEIGELPAGEGIRAIARQLTRMFGRDNEMLSLARMTFSGFDRFPVGSSTFLENGPRRGRMKIQQRIVEWAERGELTVENPQCAAEQLIELCKVSLFETRLFGGTAKASVAKCEHVAEEATLTFLARYGRG